MMERLTKAEAEVEAEEGPGEEDRRETERVSRGAVFLLLPLV
jgi:hypothetical protein